MAGLTKEQRAQRAAEKAATSPVNSETTTETTDSGETTDNEVPTSETVVEAETTTETTDSGETTDNEVPTSETVVEAETATETTDSGETETKTIEIINQPDSEENKIDTVITTITMEEPEKKVLKFSELTHKDMLVIQNTNGNKQAVTKRYWEECVASELDRLQGIILLGKYVKDESHEDGYVIEEIEDDSVVE